MGKEGFLENKIMPIISNKHVVNISFQHVDSKPDGSESAVDVHAYLEDGHMQVKLKVNNKIVVISASALSEISEYIRNSVSSNSVKSAPNSSSISKNMPYLNDEKREMSSLEKLIFNKDNESYNQSNHASSFEGKVKSYASPTMIAASSAVSMSERSLVNMDEPSDVINEEVEKPKLKGRKIVRSNKSLNLSSDQVKDDDGRFLIDLEGES